MILFIKIIDLKLVKNFFIKLFQTRVIHKFQLLFALHIIIIKLWINLGNYLMTQILNIKFKK